MNPAPAQLDNAKVLLWTMLDHRHHATGACLHRVNGVDCEPFNGLAICQFAGDEDFYLFYCDQDWQAITDTWHASLEDAMRQAQSEYTGVASTWQKNAD